MFALYTAPRWSLRPVQWMDQAMKALFAITILSFALTGCVAGPSSSNSSEQKDGDTPAVIINAGDRWRMTCNGGQGAMQVPIFARVTKSNKRTGRVDLIVTDADGFDGTAVAYLRGNTVSQFGETAEWSADGRRAVFKVDVCPDGMLIDRL